MKKYFFLFIIYIFMGFACEKKIKKAGLFTPIHSIDMGSIKFDSTYKLNYTLLNKGNANLIIDTATAGCGCSTPSIHKKMIIPGDSTLLVVTFKPADTGLFIKKIVVRSNVDSIFSIVSFNGRAIK